MSHEESESGQILPLVGLLLAAIALAAFLLANLGIAESSRAQAQAAADSVALAGAAGGKPAADEIAKQNRAVIIRYEPLGADVRVQVQLRGIRATARARKQTDGT